VHLLQGWVNVFVDSSTAELVNVKDL